MEALAHRGFEALKRLHSCCGSGGIDTDIFFTRFAVCPQPRPMQRLF